MIAHGYEHNTSNVVKSFLTRNTIKGQISEEQHSILFSMPTQNLDVEQELKLQAMSSSKKGPEKSILKQGKKPQRQ